MRLHIEYTDRHGTTFHEYDVGERPPPGPAWTGEEPQYIEDFQRFYPRVKVTEDGREAPAT